MRKIAIVTGASGGIGQVFVRELKKEILDEIWIVGRNEQRLLALKNEFGGKIVPICKDLSKSEELLSFSDLLKEQKVSVLWLVNNAGMARMAPSKEFPPLRFSLCLISIYMLSQRSLSAAIRGLLI